MASTYELEKENSDLRLEVALLKLVISILLPEANISREDLVRRFDSQVGALSETAD